MTKTDRVTVRTLAERKREGDRITMVTATDFSWARVVDRAGVDVVLVGDSLAQVVLGFDTTLPVTVDEMLVFVKAVARGGARALLVADMPFGSFQTGLDAARKTPPGFSRRAAPGR